MCESSINIMGDAMMAGIMNVLIYRLLISSRIFSEYVKQVIFSFIYSSIHITFYEKLSKKKEPFCHQPLP